MPGPHAPHTARMALEELAMLLRLSSLSPEGSDRRLGWSRGRARSMHRFATQDGALIGRRPRTAMS